MTQYARPNADVADAEWVDQWSVAGELYQLIDESSASDSDYMTSMLTNPMSDSPGDCKIALADTVDDPDTELDDHKVMYRAVGWDASMMGAPALIVSLYDTTVSTSTPIVTETRSLGDANMSGDPFVTYTLALNSTQAGNILSYDDLQIWFKRQGGSSMNDAVRVSQAWFECADEPEEEEEDTTSPAFLLFVE